MLALGDECLPNSHLRNCYLEVHVVEIRHLIIDVSYVDDVCFPDLKFNVFLKHSFQISVRIPVYDGFSIRLFVGC